MTERMPESLQEELIKNMAENHWAYKGIVDLDKISFLKDKEGYRHAYGDKWILFKRIHVHKEDINNIYAYEYEETYISLMPLDDAKTEYYEIDYEWSIPRDATYDTKGQVLYSNICGLSGLSLGRICFDGSELSWRCVVSPIYYPERFFFLTD